MPNRLFFQKAEDIAFEEEIARNPNSWKTWWFYIAAKKEDEASSRETNLIYERALKRVCIVVVPASTICVLCLQTRPVFERAFCVRACVRVLTLLCRSRLQLPGSYKLWFAYLNDRRSQLEGKPITNRAWTALNTVFERALVSQHKYPKIWKLYLTHLTEQLWITRTRRTFDRSLMSLPVTQHKQIWTLYLDFARSCGVAETGCRIFRRYLKLEPGAIEQYINFLKDAKLLDEVRRLGVVMCAARDSCVVRRPRGTLPRRSIWRTLRPARGGRDMTCGSSCASSSPIIPRT